MAKKRTKPVVVAFYILLLVIGVLGSFAGALMRPGDKIPSVRYEGKSQGTRGTFIAFSVGFAFVGAFGIWDSLRKK